MIGGMTTAMAAMMAMALSVGNVRAEEAQERRLRDQGWRERYYGGRGGGRGLFATKVLFPRHPTAGLSNAERNAMKRFRRLRRSP